MLVRCKSNLLAARRIGFASNQGIHQTSGRTLDDKKALVMDEPRGDEKVISSTSLPSVGWIEPVGAEAKTQSMQAQKNLRLSITAMSMATEKMSAVLASAGEQGIFERGYPLATPTPDGAKLCLFASSVRSGTSHTPIASLCTLRSNLLVLWLHEPSLGMHKLSRTMRSKASNHPKFQVMELGMRHMVTRFSGPHR